MFNNVHKNRMSGVRNVFIGTIEQVQYLKKHYDGVQQNLKNILKNIDELTHFVKDEEMFS